LGYVFGTKFNWEMNDALAEAPSDNRARAAAAMSESFTDKVKSCKSEQDPLNDPVLIYPES
jgi:hypothetical protein